MTPATRLLERLAKVRQRKPGQWMACCPAHDDRDPSLSIREATDGRVLVHCWGGCTADEIVGAVGLELKDLFAPGDYKPRRPGPSREAIAHEALIIEIGRAAIRRGERLSPEDAARLAKACDRMGVSNGL